MSFRQVGISGFKQMIADDISLAKELYSFAKKTDQIEAISQYLSITTFRYVPKGTKTEEQLNKLNEKIVSRMQAEGKAFVSNALVDGKYALRACIVNFRTSSADLEFLIKETLLLGDEISASL
jgi:aromatic-L-amino-acid decarboxylase